jgi:hypothetical protein
VNYVADLCATFDWSVQTIWTNRITTLPSATATIYPLHSDTSREDSRHASWEYLKGSLPRLEVLLQFTFG